MCKPLPALTVDMDKNDMQGGVYDSVEVVLDYTKLPAFVQGRILQTLVNWDVNQIERFVQVYLVLKDFCEEGEMQCAVQHLKHFFPKAFA